jgi:hypothetical protein
MLGNATSLERERGASLEATMKETRELMSPLSAFSLGNSSRYSHILHIPHPDPTFFDIKISVIFASLHCKEVQFVVDYIFNL